MANVDVTLKMAQGTTTTAPGQNPGSGNTWKQGMEADANGNWTVPSSYWYYYRHKNDNGVEQAGGEVDLPNGGTFTVAPQSSEVIQNIVVTETVPGTPSSTYYTITSPTGNSKTWSIADTEHTDPANMTDSFDVYGRDKPNDPIVKCDPIIRNRNAS